MSKQTPKSALLATLRPASPSAAQRAIHYTENNIDFQITENLMAVADKDQNTENYIHESVCAAPCSVRQRQPAVSSSREVNDIFDRKKINGFGGLDNDEFDRVNDFVGCCDIGDEFVVVGDKFEKKFLSHDQKLHKNVSEPDIGTASLCNEKIFQLHLDQKYLLKENIEKLLNELLRIFENRFIGDAHFVREDATRGVSGHTTRGVSEHCDISKPQRTPPHLHPQSPPIGAQTLRDIIFMDKYHTQNLFSETKDIQNIYTNLIYLRHYIKHKLSVINMWEIGEKLIKKICLTTFHEVSWENLIIEIKKEKIEIFYFLFKEYDVINFWNNCTFQNKITFWKWIIFLISIINTNL